MESEVQKHVACIVCSRQFRNAPRLCRFLEYVVHQTLSGNTDALKGYTIGLEVFDKDQDFDPQTDTIVRVQARALRQKLEQYYIQDGANDALRIVIKKGGYEPEFHFSSEGERDTAKKDQIENLDVSGLRSAAKPSILVLPFEAIGPPQECDFYDVGLTDGIISGLSRFRDLSVFSRATAERAKLDRMSTDAILKRFHADFVLEGSFRFGNGTVETKIRLIETASGQVILSDNIVVEKDVDDFYATQDEIVAQITARIGIESGPIGQFAEQALRSKSPTKWETYAWIALSQQNRHHPDPVKRTEVEAGLRRALRADPSSAEGHAALSLVEIERYVQMTSDCGDLKRIDRAMKHARLAVEYDPRSAMAYQALAEVYFHRHDFVEFRACVRRAVQLNPGHSDMLAIFAINFVLRAEWDEAIPLLDRVFKLNPLQPSWYHMPRAIHLMMTCDANDAIAEITRDPNPGFFAYHLLLLWFYVEASDMVAAETEKERLLDTAPDAEEFILRFFASIGMCDEIADRAATAFRKVNLKLAT